MGIVELQEAFPLRVSNNGVLSEGEGGAAHLNDMIRIVLPALLAFLGTIFGLWLGHRRWSSEFQMKKRRAFDARRHEAYDQLWKILENAHIAIRTGRPETSAVQALEQEINSFRLRNAILLDASDSELSTRYFNSIVALSKEIAKSGSRKLTKQYQSTGLFGEADVAKINDLVKANEDTSRLREELIDRIRSVMLETSYAVTAA
jgi:hypothetical protein